MDDPLNQPEAKQRIATILQAGRVAFTGHARDQMRDRQLTQQDVFNVLRGGWVEPAELERGSWRYRVCTHRMCAVVAFRSDAELVVITAWRT